METFLTILEYLGLGITGILLHTLFKASRYFLDWRPFSAPLNVKKNEKGSIAKLINDNAGKWIWCILIVLIVDLIFVIAPETGEVISDVTAIDFTGNQAGFFVFGAGLSGTISRKKNAG